MFTDLIHIAKLLFRKVKQIDILNHLSYGNILYITIVHLFFANPCGEKYYLITLICTNLVTNES